MGLMSLKAIITTFPIKRGLQVNNFQKVKILTDFSTQQYCHVEFPFKFCDKMVNKMDLLKLMIEHVHKTC